MILDLETLKHIKFLFDIHSDNSTMCNGYRSLCRMIEEIEAETKINDSQLTPISMGENFDDYLKRLKERGVQDDYKYSDEDFEKHKNYIYSCWKTNLSVYKCLECMYFEK